jgi:hypothetical protein
MVGEGGSSASVGSNLLSRLASLIRVGSFCRTRQD